MLRWELNEAAEPYFNALRAEVQARLAFTAAGKISGLRSPADSAEPSYGIDIRLWWAELRRMTQSMFQRLTDQAREAVVLAQGEARRLNHDYIGTEHLLLGLLREGDGGAARALQSQGIRLEAVRQQVEEIIGRGQQPSPPHVPFTPRAKTVLELSLREAAERSHQYAGTEHLLLGLVREGEGVAVKVLVKLGADLNRTRQRVIELLPSNEDVTGEGAERVSQSSVRLSDDPLAPFDVLEHRLAALERWVGIRPDLDGLNQEISQVRREKDAAIARQDFDTSVALRDREKQLLAARAAREKESAQAAAGRMSLAAELGQVKAELERLRAVLRQHGLDLGGDLT